MGILSDIDLVVSGINPHANIGHDVTYSGTVTAAMEAVIWGLPGLAVSLDSPDNHLGVLDYATCCRVCSPGCGEDVNEGIPGRGGFEFERSIPSGG